MPDNGHYGHPPLPKSVLVSVATKTGGGLFEDCNWHPPRWSRRPNIALGGGGFVERLSFLFKELLKPKLASTSATRTASKDTPNPESLALSNFP
jgi:hypothetical protein